MNGLSVLNIELTSRCNKSCWMCGRRKIEREYPDKVDWGNMEFDLVKEIAKQIPSGIVTQFHWNGESLLHPRFGECVSLFKHTIRCMDTNGKLIIEKADEIIDNLDTLTISVIQDDPEGEDQLEAVKRFLQIKGERKPSLIYRLLGKVHNADAWGSLPGVLAKRILHAPEGSRDYERPVTIPEIGVCLDLLTHLAVDRYGNISLCVRFDPEGKLRLGNIKEMTLAQVWYSVYREGVIQSHLEGHRNQVEGCKACHFWGVPTGC